MKRILILLTLLLCCCGIACAEPIDAFGLTVDSADETIDFDAAGINVTDADALAALIDRMPQLTSLAMYDSTMAQADMERLFDQYPDIFFGWTLHLSVHTIRTDVTAFSTLHMASPTKTDPRHTSDELRILRLCKNLKALDVGHNNLSDVEFLYDLPELEVLIISPNYMLTDITPVGSLKNLVYLECFNTQFTDVSPLANCIRLRDLNLTRCASFKDLSPLYALENLERFWWGHTNGVTNEQKKEMRALHPNCRYVSVYNPTDGGWRDHKHQKEQQAFFRTGVYVPFSE